MSNFNINQLEKNAGMSAMMYFSRNEKMKWNLTFGSLDLNAQIFMSEN